VLHTVSGKHAEYRLGKVVKLIDFGEANILPHAKGDVAGTAGYMAPEMEEEGDAAHESDM
jgi:serine/threonine protein kinase